MLRTRISISILHAESFRRLAGKTQVFVFPEDHQRTRLTHALLEVAQVAVSIATAVGANVSPRPSLWATIAGDGLGGCL
ncbi:MAG: hypothetical protein R2789_06835 [Microthrixaceae bacterium]